MSLIVPRTFNWGELNGELLNITLSKVFGKDRFSFSLVCKHWNTVAANSPYRYSPCLVYCYWRTRTLKSYQYNSFFNISFPEFEKAEIRCSKYGWLLMSRYDNTLFFFDPSNNRKLDLPCKVGYLYTPLFFFNPPTSPECVVVGITFHDPTSSVNICTLKHGEAAWEIMKFPAAERGRDYDASLGAPVLHCGLIYFFFYYGNVGIFDIEQRSMDFYFDCIRPESVQKYDDIKEQYLVKVKGDDALYGVLVFDDDREVNVLRLSSDMKWDLVEEGIGDKVFYVSANSSFGVKAPLESMQNKIYFPMFRGDVAVLYSLGDAQYQSIDGEYMENNAYGLKRMQCAAWLMPMPVEEVITPLSWL